MKPARPISIALLALVVLAGVVVGLAFVPGVQRWALLRAAAGHRGFHLELDGFSAAPSSFTVRGLRLEIDRVRVSADRLEGEYSLFDLMTGSQLEIRRLSASTLTVDATRMPRSRILAAAFASPAGAVQVQLPWQVVIGDLELAGVARLPGSPGRPDIQATFRVTGGQIAPGAEGTIRLKARLVDPMPGARVGQLDLQAALQLKQSIGRSFDRVGVTALIDASGPQISGAHQLKVAAELARLTEGETYRFHIDTLVSGHAADILDANARRGPGAAGTMAGEWTLTATSTQIEPFIIGGGLPQFDGRGHGTFHLDPGMRAVAIQGSLRASAGELGALVPALRAVGTVSVDSNFDFAADARQVRLNRLEVNLAGAQPVLQLQSAGPLALDLRDGRLTTRRPPSAVPGAGDGELVRLHITGLPLAWILPLLPAIDLAGGSIIGDLALVSDGSRITAHSVTPVRLADLTVKRGNRVLVPHAGLTFEAKAELVSSGLRVLFNSVHLSTSSADSLSGRFSFLTSLGPGPVECSGDFSGECPGLFVHWFPGSHVRAQGGIDVSINAGRWDVHGANFDAIDEHGQRLISVAAARPFAFTPGRMTVDGGDQDGVLMRITLGRLPLASLLPVPASYRLSGFTAADEFVVRGGGDRVVVACQSPLLLTDVALVHQGRSLLAGISVECSPTLEFAGGRATRLAAGDALVRDANGAPVAKLTAEVTGPWPGVRSQVAFNLDLPALGAQPWFHRGDALSAGRANGEVRGAIIPGGALQIEARATLNGLVGRDGARVLPVANLSLRTVTRLDGSFSLEAPVLIDSAGVRSDLKLSAEGTLRPDGATFEAHLTGDHVEIGDLLALTGNGGGDSGAGERALSPPAADALPFWSGWRGKLDVDVKELARGHEWSAGNVQGWVSVEPGMLTLEKLAADVAGGGKFSAVGDLTFSEQMNPYELRGRLVLADFDPGRFFRGVAPDSVPPVEGVGTLRGKWEGSGLTWDDTWDRAKAEVEYRSNGGVFRGLKRATDKISMASKAVEWSAALGSLLKTGKVKEAAEKVAGSGYYIDQLALALGEFSYDQFTFRLTRDEAMNLELTDFSITSPEIELLGAGAIAGDPGKRWTERPLKLSFNLAARGRVEQMLGRLKLLDGTRDAHDYAKARDPIVINGSVARPDALAYYLGLLTSRPTDTEDRKSSPDQPAVPLPTGPSSP
ncbi:MAG TPA: hypothetical protein VGM73_17065 [Candidatus Didemnitutus sp.]|jgi:hypothetical protein